MKSQVIALSLFILAGMMPVQKAFAYGDQRGMLQGGVQQKEFIKPQDGPRLNRNDIDQQGDPFGSDAPGGPEQFDAPDDAFQPRQGFNLQAGQQDQNLQYQQPMAQQMGNPYQGQVQQQQRQFPLSAQQEEPHMKLAWDEWHRRVAGAIYSRFNGLATTAFKQSVPMSCEVAYTVTKDRQIKNIQLLQKSPNIVFNTMVFGVVKSMNGDPLLTFPNGTARQTVDKSGTFLWNYKVQGFKYTINDQETIKNRQGR